MTIRTHPLPLLILTLRGLLVLAVAAAALVAAGPAAADSKKPPVDEHGKKACGVKTYDDGGNVTATSYFPHGSTMTIRYPDGESKKLKCNDGTWDVQGVTRPTILTEWTVRSDGLGLVGLLVAA